ncbi:MAG: hypothetical protein JWP63_6698 [Candidatus Solibacter sp.]|nr:hypothetical protein [Candidatus Solibacter sp.]
MNTKMNVQMRSATTRRFWLRRATRVATTMGLALTCLILPMRAADDGESGRKCSNATVKGDYGLVASGIRAIPPGVPGIPPGTTEMFVLTGLRTYDGNGEFRTVSDDHGQISGVSHATAAGVYQVNADCTGTATIVVTLPGIPPLKLVSTFVIVDSAKEIKEASMSALATAVLTRK